MQNVVLLRIEQIDVLLRLGDHFMLPKWEEASLLGELSNYLGATQEQRHTATFKAKYLHALHTGTGVRFALPHQLDRTQWEDLYDAEKHKEYEKTMNGYHGKKYPEDIGTSLSYSWNLRSELIGWRALADRKRPFGIFPEISRNGGRRCIFVDHSDRRCKSYTHDGVLCRRHADFEKYLKGYLIVANNSKYAALFKNKTLGQLYEDFLNSDARDVVGEIALMRTMLGSLVKAIPQEMDAGKVPIEVIDKVVKITDRVTNSIERYDRMQQKLGNLITPEQLSTIMWQMLEIIKKVLDLEAEQFVTLAESFQNLTITRGGTGYLELGADGPITDKYGYEDPPVHVKKTNCRTRYGEDGEIYDCSTERELQQSRDATAAIVSKGGQHREFFYTEGDYNPDTEVGRRKVEYRIGGPDDPFHW